MASCSKLHTDAELLAAAVLSSGLTSTPACPTMLSGAACPSRAVGFVTNDDGSGMQRWTLTYVAGTMGVRPCLCLFSLCSSRPNSASCTGTSSSAAEAAAVKLQL